MNRLMTLLFSLLLLAWTVLPGWSAPGEADEAPTSETPTATAETTSPAAGQETTTAEPAVGMNPSTGQSMPRVMLTAFSTTPDVVQAGEPFTVNFTVQNMSKRSRVSNLKVTLSGADGAFLPANGSSSTYIASIKPEGSVGRTMDFASLPSLEDRPYQMTLSVEYEDADFNQLASQETVSVLITQAARADATEPQIMPSELTVGQDASVMFSVNNLGKSKMFNVRASLEEQEGLSTPDAFVGSIEPGASGSVEMLIHADKVVKEPSLILVTYENAEGDVSTIEQPLQLTVVEEMPMEEPMMGPEEPAEIADEGAVSPLFWAVGLGVLLLAALVLLFVMRGRKRRRERQSREDDMQLLDDTLIVPPGQ